MKGLGKGGFLARLGVTIYPGEGRLAGLLFSSFFLCVTFQYAAKTVRQATFIDSLGATQLPLAYFLVALCSYPVAKLYARLSGHLSRYRLAVATFGLVAMGLVVFWWLFQFPWKWVPMVFYVFTGIAVALTLSQLWSLSSHVLDTRQSKRLFGFLGAGALLGGIAGGLAARVTAQLSETRHSLLFVAVLLSGVVFAVYRIQSLDDSRSEDSEKHNASTGVGDTRDALATLLRSGQLRLIAVLMLMVVVVSQIIDLQFSWAVESATSNLEDRTAFFGNFFAVMGVAAFAFQLVLTTRIHRLLGVGFALRVLPSSLAIGTAVLFVAGSFFPGAILAVAVGLKIAENGIRYSLDDSTRELLFLPVPSADRAKTKTFLDVFVKRAAKGLAALLLIPVTLGWVTPLQTGWLSLLVIVLWLALTWRITREYVLSFRRGLKQKSVDSGSQINLSDVTTLEILVQSFGSPDPRQVLHSLDILSANRRGHLVPPLLLYHDDAEVRRRTLQILSAEGRADAAPLVERRLSDQDPAVRAEATRVLADLWHQDACDMMLPRLRSPDPGVRAAAIACLANHGNASMREEAEKALQDMTSDAEPAIRIEAVRAVGAISEPQFERTLVQMLYDQNSCVVRAAVRGIKRRVARDGQNPLYVPTLISLLANRRLKHDAREALAAFGEVAIPALRLFMKDPEEPVWVRRAIPKTISLIDSPLAAEALVAALENSTDTFMRRKLLEALGALDGMRDDLERKLKIRREIRVEAKRYLVVLADLFALDRDAAIAVDRFSRPRPTFPGGALLEQLLAETGADLRKNLFALLALVYERRPIWDAYRSLQNPTLRANAIEFLDCTLEGEDKSAVLAAVGDAPLVDKLSLAERNLGIIQSSRKATILKHLSPHDERTTDLPHLAVAAMYTVFAQRIEDLYPVVDSLRSTATDPFVLETADWIAQRRSALPNEGSP